MLMEEEKRYLAGIPKRQVVVEMGCWLGSSSQCFAGHELWSYDRFQWDAHMCTFEPRPIGSCFLDEWKANVGEGNYHRVFKVDCETAAFELPERIDVLFLDVLKTKRIMWNVLRQCLPRVRPEGLVLDQDFTWQPAACPWRIGNWYALQDIVRPINHTGHMMTFRLNRKPTQAEVEAKLSRLLCPAQNW